MLNNKELFLYSINTVDTFMDYVLMKQKYYNNIYEEELFTNNKKLIEEIDKYKRTNWNTELNNILKIVLNSKLINFTEFVSFWNIYWISHSYFSEMSETEQKTFLKFILKEFIEKRHNIYQQNWWYSKNTIQALIDSNNHKRNSNIWKFILNDTLLEQWFVEYWNEWDTLNNFLTSKKWILYSDWKGKQLFIELLERLKINFEWNKKYQNKFPDLCLNLNWKIFIIEHKYINEKWGWQNKQLEEIINFVNQKENLFNVYYIAVLDWLYMNNFKEFKNNDNKLAEQYNDILTNLWNNPKNYFLNKNWLIKLIKNI